MSRIGKLPVPIPGGVKCDIDGSRLTVTGPKGSLEREFRPEISLTLEGNEILVARSTEKKEHRAWHGLTRALVANMVKGVTDGFERILLIEGVGYRASKQGKNLNLALGYSHPVTVEPPDGIEFTVDGTQTVKVQGIDKELVGQISANIRKIRPPEPYKGKGVRYSDEHIRRKVSKAGAK